MLSLEETTWLNFWPKRGKFEVSEGFCQQPLKKPLNDRGQGCDLRMIKPLDPLVMVFFCNTLKNLVNDHTCLHFDQHPDLYLLLYVSGDRHQYQRPGFLVQARSKLHVPPVTQDSRNLRPGSRHMLWNALGYAKVKYKKSFMACSKHHYRRVHPSKVFKFRATTHS